MNIIIQDTVLTPILQIQEIVNEIVLNIDETVINSNIVVEDIVTNISLTIDEKITNVVIEVQDVAIPGQQGIRGLSNYDIAVQNGFIGSENEWLQALSEANIDGGIIY